MDTHGYPWVGNSWAYRLSCDWVGHQPCIVFDHEVLLVPGGRVSPRTAVNSLHE